MWLAVALAAAQAAPPGSATNWALVWQDEFTGTAIDPSKWIHWLPGARRSATNTSNAVSVGGGNCTITTYTSGGTHYTGMLATQGKFEPAYGYIEARIEYDSSPGMWSAFWLQSPTMGNPLGNPEVAGTEVDISEHRSQNSSGTNIGDLYYNNVHWDGYGASHESSEYQETIPGLGSGFHVYGLEWTPTVMRFYVDGVLRRTFTSPISQRSEFIILSSEVENGGWSGNIPAAGYGALGASTTKMIVDYVRVYKRAERVDNGGFDAGKTVAPWYQVNEASLTTGNGRGGTQGVRVNPSTAAGSAIKQTLFGLLPNTDYLLTAWGNPAATTWAPIRLGVEDHGGAQAFQALNGTTYARAVVPFTTGPANTTATVFGWQPTQWGDAYVDDFLLRRAGAVTNGTLESGDFGPWTSYGSTSVAADGGANLHSGSYALKYASASSGAEQEIAGLRPSTSYRLSAWAVGGAQIGVKNHGGTQVTGTTSGSTWARSTLAFTTGSSNTTATIFGWRPGGTTTAYADDFFVYEPLGAPWLSQDVTDIPLDGVAGRRGSRFVVQASGADIWQTSDRFHFVYQQLTGDGQITARVCALENTGTFAKAGVMMRESVSSFVPQVTVNWTPGETVEQIRRSAANANATSTIIPNVSAPPWVRLTRRGNVFTSYFSPDGVTWAQAGPAQTIAMPQTICVGLATCAFSTTAYAEAAYDSVVVENLPPNVQLVRPASDTLTIPGGGPVGLRLTATAADDGLRGAITVQGWTQVSGPATVAFANAGGLDTMATFPQSGTYVVRCTASNNLGPGTRDVVVTVLPASDPALVFWLKGNESGGATAADSSGNGLHATVASGASFAPAGGVLLGGLQFNGSAAGYLEVPDHNLLDNTAALTVAFWMKPNAINVAGLVSKRTSFSNQHAYMAHLSPDALDATRGRIAVDIDGIGNRFISNAFIDTGAWYHVAVVFDGTLASEQRARLFINGVLDTVAAESSTAIPNYSSTLKLGIADLTTTAYFNGMLDDARVYRRALSAAEVATLASTKIAPTLSPGVAPAAMSAIAAPLSGSAGSEVGGAVTSNWNKASGPGTVAFSNPSALAGSATFGQAGSYALRLTATHASSELFRDLTVDVAANGNVFADWIGAAFPGQNNPALIGFNADPERDGARNGVEFALGLAPGASDAAPWAPSRAGLPVPGIRNFSGTSYLCLDVRRPIGRLGVATTAVVSANLGTWNPAVQVGAPVANGDGSETVTFRDTVPAGTAPRFIRLKVTQQ